MDDLLPCPFCGKIAAVNEDHNSKGFHFYVFCSNCFVRTDNYINPRMAIDMWNTRHNKGENE